MMTNAAGETTVAGTDGQTPMVKYKNDEKKIIVPPEAIIVKYVAGEKSELKPGAKIFIVAAQRQPDGTLQAAGGAGRAARAAKPSQHAVDLPVRGPRHHVGFQVLAPFLVSVEFGEGGPGAVEFAEVGHLPFGDHSGLPGSDRAGEHAPLGG